VSVFTHPLLLLLLFLSYLILAIKLNFGIFAEVTAVNTASGQQLLLSPQSAKKRLFMEQAGGGTRAGQSLLQSSGGRVAINIQSKFNTHRLIQIHETY
jgi:hypothetical protein